MGSSYSRESKKGVPHPGTPAGFIFNTYAPSFYSYLYKWVHLAWDDLKLYWNKMGEIVNFPNEFIIMHD